MVMRLTSAIQDAFWLIRGERAASAKNWPSPSRGSGGLSARLAEQLEFFATLCVHMSTYRHAFASEPSDRLLSASQAAHLLNVHISTIRRWIANGKLPAYRIGDKGVRVRYEDVIRLITPLGSRSEQGGRAKQAVEFTPRRLTLQEQKRALAAIDAAEKLEAEIRAQNQGKPLPDSASLIRSERERRTWELMRALEE
jgi:excisionase family DNA binding protein